MMLKRKWIDKLDLKTEKSKIISQKLNIPFLTSKILISRGYDTVESAKKFIKPVIKDLNDPFLFKDMKKVVNRIENAMKNNESIWIYGDYDVDGITSVSILINYFKSINYDVNFYIPNRKNEGYGISKTGVEYIFNNQGKLIISVDCGITANEMADYCNELNMDVVITDHHTCGEILPNAFAILNPKVDEDNYPYDMLAGVGIAFKLIQALSKESFYDIYLDYIDIVAFGTIADIAPLDGENHIIAKLGLKQLANTNNLGMKALIEVSDLNDKEITAGIVGFRLAPQINATGRLGKANLGVKLLTSTDVEEVYLIAKELKNLNEQRKLIEKAIFIKSKKYIENNIDLKNESVIVVYGEGFHSGVIGIVASRITEEFGKPAIVLTKDADIVKGSARSIGNFSIYDAIKSAENLLVGFGGHKMAAGLSIEEKNVQIFRKKINEYVINNVDPNDLFPIIKYEGCIESNEIVLETINYLDYLKPFGVGNPKPTFIMENCKVIDSRTVGKDKNHLKIILGKDNQNNDAIGFGLGHLIKSFNRNDLVNVLISLDINNYNGITTPQLLLKDIKTININNGNQEFLKNEYLKTIYASLKNNISYFNNIDFSNLLIKKDLITSIDQKTLILISSLNSVSDKDRKKFESWKFSFNNVSEESDKDILVNPILRNIKMNNYDQIIFYDIPIRKKKEKLINYISKARINNLISIFKEIPNREELIVVYKEILTNNSIFLKKIADRIDFSEIKVQFSLEILKEVKVIDFKYNSDKINTIILPKPTKKNNIEDHLVYKKFLELKRKVI